MLAKLFSAMAPRSKADPRPLYRSRFGGLWIDRSDADAVLARKVRDGEVDIADIEPLRHFHKFGYAILERAVPHPVIDEYLAFLERSWDAPPPGIYAHCEGQVLPLSRALYERVAKVSDLHYYFADAEQLVFAPPVRRFLEAIYERPAVVFQTMTMRKGSEEPLHTDTGPLTLTEPMSLAAAWIALEDVRPGAGALQFVPGSHALPEVLNNGVSKGHNGDMGAYHKVLQSILASCAERKLPTEHFMAKKGDVLVWAADLMHGGSVIQDRTLTRKSLVAHYMPLGAMATFYDFSKVNYVPYAGGGWRLDRLDPARG